VKTAGPGALALLAALLLAASVAACGDRQEPKDETADAAAGPLARSALPGGVPQGEATGPGAARQAEVAARGAQVMPFDLDLTTHTFVPRPGGGVQTVKTDDPLDIRQSRLIRAHLREEAARFARGDFSDPSHVHGDEMPGLAELKAGADRIEVRYESLPDGGRITYTTADPVLATTLHAWFRAQVSDHGAHARP
jgi:hypothetical protein